MYYKMSDDRSIKILCELQEALNQIGFVSKLSLPTIVVVGSQSSGKSSVLENIAGKDFLPRGQGIVTRCPIIIQRFVDQTLSNDFAIVGDLPNQKFTDFEKVRQYLQKRMNDLSNSNSGISEDPLIIKIFVRVGVNLSIIDMPGLTKIALQGQPMDLPSKIEEINKRYIQNPNSIILAISPSNVDVANSDALSLAKEVDPTGERTIGVFTKMDLVDDPNNVKRSFEGKAYPLKHGYYGVVCRSQGDINSRMIIDKALEKESQYFQTSEFFAGFRNNCGTANLILKINKTLLLKIKETLPFIKSTLQLQIRQKEDSFQNFRKVNELHKSQAYSALLLNLVNNFVTTMSSTLKGGSANLKIKDKLFGGAKVTLIFEEEFRRKLFDYNIFENVKDDEIYWMIKNSSGLQQNTGFNNESFETLVKRQILELKNSCVQCLLSVSEEIRNIVKDIIFDMKEFEVFERAGKEIIQASDELMVKYQNDARLAIDVYFRVQSGYVNQKHPTFAKSKALILKGSYQMNGPLNQPVSFFDNSKKGGSTPNLSENYKEVNLMKQYLMAYCNVVKEDSYDFTQKAIVSLFINEMLANSDREILNKVLSGQNEKTLCQVDQVKVSSMGTLEKEIDNLRRCLQIIDQVN